MASLLDKDPSGGGIARCRAPHQITAGIRYILEVLLQLSSLGQILWRVRWGYLFFHKVALSGICGSSSFNHVVWPKSPCVFQVRKLVFCLKRRRAALMELLDDPTRLIEVFVDDPLRYPVRFPPQSAAVLPCPTCYARFTTSPILLAVSPGSLVVSKTITSGAGPRYADFRTSSRYASRSCAIRSSRRTVSILAAGRSSGPETWVRAKR
jgi:hypothetical protein